MSTDSPELQDLVDSPRERPDVEYKAWIDLMDGAVKAKMARHLCALANHGGGYLVFGIDDDMTPSSAPPVARNSYDQDTLSGIVKRYLTPVFQVRVHQVTASTGGVHPVVWVPPHGPVPVCSRRDGPGGTGISAGTHYTRGVGPASEPVTTPEMWAPIIRRCVRNDRQALLAALDGVLRPPNPEADTIGSLRLWHEAARKEFLSLAQGDPATDRVRRAHFQLSYRVEAEGQLDMAELVKELRGMGHEVRQFMDPGWSVFEVVDAPERRPQAVSDQGSGVEEFLESRLVGPGRETHLVAPEFWRIAPEGMATLVRAYPEDFRRRGQPDRLAPGAWFWPQRMACALAELLRHAGAFAKRLDRAKSITFLAEWWGLEGRRPENPAVPLLRTENDVAMTDTCRVTKTVSVADVDNDWQALTAASLSRVLRVFDAQGSVSGQDIEDMLEVFRR